MPRPDATVEQHVLDNAVEPPGQCSSAHDRAASLRLHRTVPAVEGGAATVRPAVGPRNQSMTATGDGAPGWIILGFAALITIGASRLL
jgi:hypothetical protein